MIDSFAESNQSSTMFTTAITIDASTEAKEEEEASTRPPTNKSYTAKFSFTVKVVRQQLKIDGEARLNDEGQQRK